MMDDETRKKLDKENRAIEMDEITRILSTENGRKFMFGLLEHTGFESDTFHENPYRHAYNSGRRSMGTFLAQTLKHAEPDLYARMIEEN